MAALKINDEIHRAKPITLDGPGIAKKIRDGLKVANLALDRGLMVTPYFYEALAYAAKAKRLQDASLAARKVPKVGDPLMETIPIYNTVQRRYAGFSNVLEMLWYGNFAPKAAANQARGFTTPILGQKNWKHQVTKEYRIEQWLYVCLAHRITGSGASFEWDHGFRNNRIAEMSTQGSTKRMAEFLATYDGPIFTSLGNQIPPFPKCGGREYLKTIAPDFVMMMYAGLMTWVNQRKSPMPIKEAVDMALRFHKVLGCKQFKFVITAWIMDIAEYLPHLVDRNSDVYHGKNAMEAIDICFEDGKMTKQAKYDTATRIFATATGTYPMDVEDAAPGCDFVRWIENYVPKKGFDHVHADEIFNGNSLVWNAGRQPLPF